MGGHFQSGNFEHTWIIAGNFIQNTGKVGGFYSFYFFLCATFNIAVFKKLNIEKILENGKKCYVFMTMWKPWTSPSIINLQ